MKSSRLTHVALFALAGLTAACSAPTDPDLYAPELVLKAMLPVNEGIDTVFLSKTLPLNTGYTFEKAAISGADIRITAETGESVVLQEYAGKPGRYGAPLFTIKPLTTYFLSVTVDGFPSISAETKTPGVLNPLIVNKDSVSFIGDSFNTDSLSVQWNAVEGSVNYLISSRFLGPDSTKIRIDTPFNEEDDPEEDPNVRSSWVNVTRGRLYGFFHRYYGDHQLTIIAMDQALYNYIKTQFQNPRQVNEPLSNLSSGVGYFGSGSRQVLNYRITY